MPFGARRQVKISYKELVYFHEECNKLRLYNYIRRLSIEIEIGVICLLSLKKAYIASSRSDLLVNKQ